MDWTGKGINWVSRLALAFGIAGLLFIWIPFVCYLSPFLSQTAILLGLIGYVKYSREGNEQNRLPSTIGMIIGLVALIIAALMYIQGYIQGWSLW